LIGHSMGGVVAREYTQNSDYYHGDVDKVITLDSPHEGTGALNMQLDMVDGVRATAEGVNSSFLMEGM
ncbi:esterase/lipase family protein, partial [Fibrobacter intestinalis]